MLDPNLAPTRRRSLAPWLAMLLLACVGTLSAEEPTLEPLAIDLEPPARSITAITRTTDGLLWLGTDTGLVRHDSRHAVRFDRARISTLPSNRIRSLAAGRGGTLWVGSEGGGLARFDGTAFRPISRPISGGTWSVTALLATREGPLYIGTPDSLLSLAWGASSSSHGLPGVRVTALEEDDSGQIWAAAGSSLFRRAQTVFQPIPLSFGFSSSPIADLEVVGGDRVWIAREDGLVRLDGDFRGLGLPRSADLVDGIGGPVCCVVADRDGVLWAAADATLHRLGPESSTTELPAPITALYVDGEGDLWIATDGAGVWRRPSPTPIDDAPASRLIALRIDGEPLPSTSARVVESADTVEIDVVAPTFHEPEAVTLVWRIDDGPWHDVDGTIVLSDVSAGEHVVEVLAQRGALRGTPLRVDFEIRPRLVETLPFWIAAAALLTISLGAWLLLGWRRRRVEQWLEEQEAADRADLEILDDSSVVLGPRRIDDRDETSKAG